MSHPPGYLDPRSVRAYRAAHRSAVTFTERAVLDDLERCQRRYGRATPSVEGMAQRCGRSPRSVIRATSALERAGQLRIVRDRARRRRDGTYWRARTNLYVVTFAPRRPCSHRGDMNGTSMASSHTEPVGGGGPVDDRPPPLHLDTDEWPLCIEQGCDVHVDPWDHNTRCPIHRPVFE